VGEGAIYMGRSCNGNCNVANWTGTSLRELVHKFRHKTLILVKMLMLQKKVSIVSFFALCHADQQIMLFGYPVEMLCTYQYSLVSLIPGEHH
jgi:hypothetical protein